MRALVTGGAGFIGSHIVEALLKKEGFDQVVVLDALSKGKLANIKSLIDAGKVKFVEGDVRSKEIVDNAMKGIDYVFHTAAFPLLESSKSPEECIDINIKGSYNIFNSALANGVKRVIFSSSASVYGEPKKLPMNEEDQPNPVEPYGASKLCCEQLLKYLKTKGLKWNALRYFNVYGERQAAQAYYTEVILNLVKNIMNNRPAIVEGNADQSMDFTHVSDIVAANIAAMKSKAENEIFNVGTGVSTTLAQLADIVIKALNKNVKPIFVPREVFVSKRKADTAKAERLLGFKAQIKIEAGLGEAAREIAAHLDRY